MRNTKNKKVDIKEQSVKDTKNVTIKIQCQSLNGKMRGK